MDAIKNVLKIQENQYRQQELLGSIVAAAVIGFGGKHVSQLANKTIAAAAANGFGLAVSIKSVGTIYSNWRAEEGKEDRKSAYKALGFSTLLMTATTLLRATNFADTKFNVAPQANMHLKPLLILSAGTCVLSEVGLKIVKKGNEILTNRREAAEAIRRQEAEDATVERLVALTEEQVAKMDEDQINEYAVDLNKAFAFSDEKKLDALAALLNAQAAELDIEGWEDIARVPVPSK